MKRATPILSSLAALLLATGVGGPCQTASALDPPPAPFTLWNFLGIQQTSQKIYDTMVNRNGLNPQRERTPRLKAIADPNNFASPNPAIQKAAEIKADQDLAPQKIKAIRFLATVGCGCPEYAEKVHDALLAALDDCNCQVRCEAAKAICQTSGSPCATCGPNSCCSEDIMKKLDLMANGTDDKGCPVEPSEGVRAMAAAALNACHQKHGSAPLEPTPAVEPRPTVAPEPGVAPQTQAEPKMLPMLRSANGKIAPVEYVSSEQDAKKPVGNAVEWRMTSWPSDLEHSRSIVRVQ